MQLDMLTGTAEYHLLPWCEGVLVHRDVLKPLQELRERASEQGFDLQVCSGFRSFQRQQLIWDAKLGGQRKVLDDNGGVVDLQQLSPWQQLQAVLRWSALPGASRHHWGTDLDIYDAASLPPGYQLQLTADEVKPGGVLGHFHAWLDEALEGSDFYRPYAEDRGGVAVERWHISYRPLAMQCAEALQPALLEQFLAGTSIASKEVVLAHFAEIYRRYICVS